MSSPPNMTTDSVIMPADVRPTQVISLVEIAEGKGGKVNARELAHELGADLTNYPSILRASEILGLTLSEAGEVSLTDKGLRFLRSSNRRQVLKETLVTIEPFRTALEIARGGELVKAARVAHVLSGKGITWHFQSEINVSIIETLLVSWALPLQLLTFESGGFRASGSN